MMKGVGGSVRVSDQCSIYTSQGVGGREKHELQLQTETETGRPRKGGRGDGEKVISGQYEKRKSIGLKQLLPLDTDVYMVWQTKGRSMTQATGEMRKACRGHEKPLIY